MGELIPIHPEDRRSSLTTQFALSILDLAKTKPGGGEQWTLGLQDELEGTHFASSYVSDTITMWFYYPVLKDGEIQNPQEANVTFNERITRERFATFKVNEYGSIQRTLGVPAELEWDPNPFVTRDLTILEMERLIAAIKMPTLMVENIKDLLTPNEEEARELEAQKRKPHKNPTIPSSED